MKTAVAYLRARTDEQHLGPEAQRAAIEMWAGREGVHVASWHVDHGVSGAAPIDARPGLLQAVAELRKGAAFLVVAKRDRLARDVVIAALIDRLVERYGGRLVSADGVGAGDGPESRFMRTIIDAASEYERALIRTRTKVALAAKRARGERVGTCAFGYREDAGRLLPDDAEQRIVERIRTLARLGMSTRAIVRKLASQGVVGRTGRVLGQTQIVRLLRAA
jgi:DNA invertase Pin-like site-specific DNA recombinase